MGEEEIRPFAHLSIEELMSKIVDCEKEIQKEEFRRKLTPILQQVKQDQGQGLGKLQEQVRKLERYLKTEKRARQQLNKELKKAREAERDYDYAQEECEASRDVAMKKAAHFAQENEALKQRVKDLEQSEKKLKAETKKAEKQCKKLKKQRLCCVCQDDHAAPMIRCRECTLVTHIRCQQRKDRDMTMWICADCMDDMEESEEAEKEEE